MYEKDPGIDCRGFFMILFFAHLRIGCGVVLFSMIAHRMYLNDLFQMLC